MWKGKISKLKTNFNLKHGETILDTILEFDCLHSWFILIQASGEHLKLAQSSPISSWETMNLLTNNALEEAQEIWLLH